MHSSNNNKLMRVLLFKNTSPLPFLITFIIICLVNDIVISHAKTIGPPPPSLKCGLDSPKYFYPGLWNRTSLRKCTGATRPEKMCIIGGGSSGVHMGWLLKRRGFENTVLYEQNDRLGGFVWTRPKDAQTNVTRELGAEFLSPDYVEVREFLKRYNQTDVPLSVKHMMHFHNTSNLPTPTSTKGTASLNVGNNSSSNFRSRDIPELPSIYYNNWLKNYTGSNDPNINGKLVSDALNKYYAISAKIFGKYKGRFPPRPKTKEQLLMLNGTAIDFLKRNDIELLYPLMYQFFVLQGMGLLKEMSAYYMLKWCNPVSMQGGGFGNKEYPLAMLKDGYGGIINNMAKEVNLNVKYGHKVKNILRSSVAMASSLPVTLQFEDSSTQPDATCDFVILSGPITNYVRGSNDLKVGPILNEVSVGERSLFYNKQAMQFLVSLVEFENVPNEFQTLEFWPSNFQKKGSVIVRRDIGYAETGKSHRVGGIQSFSYYPYPQCNRSTHWEEQQNWAKKHNKKITKMLGQFYVDTYYFHYNNEEVMEGKIWDLDDLQMGDGICNCTLYVGGCASYETVEDSMHYNLQLVDKLIDQVDSATNNDNDDGGGNIAELIGHYTTNRQQEKDITLPTTIRTPSYLSPLPPFTSPVTTVIELLNINVPCKNVDKFLWADNETWTKVLKLQPGFVEKIVTVDPTTRGNNTASTVCTIWKYILWESYALWKSVPSQVLIETDNAMAQLYGEEVPVTTFPPNNKNGLNILYDTMQPIGGIKPVALKKEAVEFNRLIIDCRHIDQFVRADNSTWTQFLSSKPGFKRKILSMVHDNVTNKCEMYTFVEWDSYALWKQVCGTPSGEKECAEIQTKFAKQFGFPAPSIQRTYYH
jgi:uncharacterized protein (TIGR03792 family)